MLLAYADSAMRAAVLAVQRADGESESSSAALLELLTLMGTFSSLAALARFGVSVTFPVSVPAGRVLQLGYHGVAFVIEPVLEEPNASSRASQAPPSEIERARVISVKIDGVELTAAPAGRSRRAALRSVSS